MKRARIDFVFPNAEKAFKFERKVLDSETAITSADFDEMADGLANQLKNSRSEEKKIAIIMAFLRKNIWSQFLLDGKGKRKADISAARQQLDKIIAALVERLKVILDVEDVRIVEESLRNFDSENMFIMTPPERKNAIVQVSDKAGGPEVARTHIRIKPENELAFDKFTKIKPHPNLLQFYYYDEKSHNAIVEMIPNVHSLEKSQIGILKFKQKLMVLRDCLLGSEHLRKNGLMLQDISLENLVFELDEKRKLARGLLADFEGLRLIGRKRGTPVVKAAYQPPEFTHPDASERVATPSEMVFQFGVCLDKIMKRNEDYEKIMGGNEGFQSATEDLSNLKMRMLNREPSARPRLTEIIKVINNEITKLP